MRFISWNVNGIKAWVEHGGLDEIMKLSPDILCLQETKADDAKFDYWTSDYTNSYKRFHQASSFKAGYAGVGILIKHNLIDTVISSNTFELGTEYESGRILHLEFPDYHFIGVYTLNSGDKDDERKSWDSNFLELIRSLTRTKPIIIMGDINVVNTVMDYWKNSVPWESMPGLKSYERAGFKLLLDSIDLCDSYRELHPSQRQFSWFSYRGGAYDNNQGWRIDYALVSKILMPRVKSSIIYDNIRYSDHCPIELIID